MKKHITLAAVSLAALIAAGTPVAFAQQPAAGGATTTAAPVNNLAPIVFQAGVGLGWRDPAFTPTSVGRGWPFMPMSNPVLNGQSVTTLNNGAAIPMGATACANPSNPAGATRCDPVAALPNNTTYNPTVAFLERNPGITACAAADATVNCIGQGPVGGNPPPGVTALERDLYTSNDFYLDRALWSDPRYFRCNSPYAVESTYALTGGNGSIRVESGAGKTTARWGDCKVDLPVESMYSPYPFGSAQAHYEALLAEARAHGGPTIYNQQNPAPDWTGRYTRQSIFPQTQFMDVLAQQSSTHLQLFTEEYQYRAMQELYHHGNTNAAMWPSQFCWPEGFMRYFSLFAVRDHHIFMTPQMMIMQAGVADNFQMQFNFNRTFDMSGAVPRIGADVRRWYGNSIGFWDGEVFITWTSNIQGWITHSMGEVSDSMQAIIIFTPIKNAMGAQTGLNREVIFYDPVALVSPVRIAHNLINKQTFDTNAEPYTFIECNPTIFPIDGRAQQVTAGTTIPFTVPSWFQRPWASQWTVHEQTMRTDLWPRVQLNLF